MGLFQRSTDFNSLLKVHEEIGLGRLVCFFSERVKSSLENPLNHDCPDNLIVVQDRHSIKQLSYLYMVLKFEMFDIQYQLINIIICQCQEPFFFHSCQRLPFIKDQ